VLTRTCHWPLSSSRWTQSTSFNHISLRPILILSSRLLLCLRSGFYLSVLPTKILYAFLIFSMRCYMPHPSHIPWFVHSNVLYGYSRDSSVGIVLGYGMDDRGSRVRFPTEAGNFSLHHRLQNVSGVHPASYPIDTAGSFPGGKAVGREADHSPLSSAEVKECVELCLHSPNTLSWRGAQLKHRDNNYTFTFTPFRSFFFLFSKMREMYNSPKKCPTVPERANFLDAS
jgi:hypothetical protein